MNHLLIDTSSKNSSLILNINNEIVYSKFWRSENNHSEELYENFSEISNRINEIYYIGILLGPGGFNSIRIGISFALAIVLSKNIKVIGLPTHLVQAINYIESKKDITSIIKCGKNIISWAKFTNGEINPTELGTENINIYNEKNICGEIPDLNDKNPRPYENIIKASNLLIEKNGFDLPEDIVPIYAKKPSISKPKEPYKKFEIKGE
jgi:tRNA threonylcarbamoyl adenosine modification protein YeaZ|tara:strand:- start:1267 stop:1890 length:624 start_codon:yes stop_codon:yes gene_type:complete